MFDFAVPLAAVAGYPPNIEPHPSDFSAGATSEWAFFFIAGAAVVILALPWAIRAAKNRNPYPLIVMFSGLLCSLEEPMLDILGHLHWANDLTTAFTNFAVPVPLLIPLCYVAFLGLMSYFCYFVIRNGAKVQHFMMLLAMGLILDAVMETIGINLNVYEYYGVQPFELFGFPYWWGFINGASFVAVGTILAYAIPRVKGPQKALLVFAAPAGMMINYFVFGSIHILAHNADLAEWIRWVAAAIMMGEMVFAMKIYHSFVGVKVDAPAPNWTLPRMFQFVVLPERKRNELFAKMCREGGVPLTEPLPPGMLAPPPYATDVPVVPGAAPAREPALV